MRKVISLILVLIFCFSTVSFAANETSDKPLKLQAVDGKGKFAGYKLLKGHPDEKKFEIYFKVETKGSITSYEVKVSDIRKIDLNAVVKWQYKGKTYKTKKKDLFNYFADVTALRNKFKISNSTDLSPDWLKQTFGKVYVEWAEGYYFADEASRLVKKYIDSISSPENTKDEDVDIKAKMYDLNKKELKEFNDKWIGEEELYDSFGVKIRQSEGKIEFWRGTYASYIVYEIESVPKEPVSEKVYTENGISYQFIEEKLFTGSLGEQLKFHGFYFNREDLKGRVLIFENEMKKLSPT